MSPKEYTEYLKMYGQCQWIKEDIQRYNEYMRKEYPCGSPFHSIKNNQCSTCAYLKSVRHE